LFAAAVHAEGDMGPPGEMGGHGEMDGGHGDMEMAPPGEMGGHGDMEMAPPGEAETTADPMSTMAMESTTDHHMMLMTHPEMGHEESHYEPHHEEPHHEEPHHEKPHHEMPKPCNSCGCNAEEMAQWKDSMMVWKHDHTAWMHEFKAWQMEFGDAEIDWDHHDMDMGHKEDHKPNMPNMPDMGGNMGDMMWILEFLGNENMICPIFNMFIDESWGVGTAAEWEMGCRSSVQITNRWMSFFDGSNKYEDNASLAKATCDMLLFSLNEAVPGANMAGDMCQCIMENVLAVGVTGNVDMSMLGGAMECVSMTQEFIGMIMGNGDMGSGDMGSGDHGGDVGMEDMEGMEHLADMAGHSTETAEDAVPKPSP